MIRDSVTSSEQFQLPNRIRVAQCRGRRGQMAFRLIWVMSRPVSERRKAAHARSPQLPDDVASTVAAFTH